MVADTYTSTLGTLVMGTGNDNNTWGTNANSAVFQILEDAIANILTITDTSGTKDLSGTPPPAAASAARYWQLNCTGVLVGNLTIQVPNLSKGWLVNNACTLGAFSLKMKTPAGTAVTIPAGWGYVWCDGANVINVSPYFSLSLTLPSQTLAPNGSVGAPSYSFTNEPTTGVYLTAGHLNFAQGGVKVLDLASGAAILTGTLAVSSTSAFTGAATFTGAANFNGGGAISGTFTGGATFSGDIVFSSTDWTQLASGTTGQQPAAGAGGRVRWNTSTSRLTLDYGAAWNNVLTSAEVSSTAQAQAQTDNTTFVSPAALLQGMICVGFKYAFTAGTGSTTTHTGSSSYTYSHTVAPVFDSALTYRTDDVTLAYAGKVATNVLRIRHVSRWIGDFDAGNTVPFLLVDSGTTAVDWHVFVDTGGNSSIISEFLVALSDTSSHTYKVGFTWSGTTSQQGVAPGRRLFTIEELRVG